MLRIAVQSKGRLFDDTMNLLAEADIKVSSGRRTLLVQSQNFPLEVLYLRDDDIPQSVASGVADIGVVGENEFVERGEDAEIISRLGFSKCRLSLAIPKDINYQGLAWFNGKNILEMKPEDRAHEGLFLSFQYPVEIPGVSMTNFLKAAVNEKRKYQGQPELKAGDFLKLMNEKRKVVELDSKFTRRSVNEGFSGGEKKRNEIF